MKKIVRLIKYIHTVETEREITVEVDDDFDTDDLTIEQEVMLEDLFDKAIEEASATNDLNTASGWYDTEILGEWEK